MEPDLHENQANNDSNPGLNSGSSEENASMIPPHLKGRELWRSLEQLAETDVMVDEQVDRMLDDVTDTLKVPDKDRAAVLKELVKHFQH